MIDVTIGTFPHKLRLPSTFLAAAQLLGLMESTKSREFTSNEHFDRVVSLQNISTVHSNDKVMTRKG